MAIFFAVFGNPQNAARLSRNIFIQKAEIIGFNKLCRRASPTLRLTVRQKPSFYQTHGERFITLGEAKVPDRTSVGFNFNESCQKLFLSTFIKHKHADYRPDQAFLRQ